jgi:transposase-like protein
MAGLQQGQAHCPVCGKPTLHERHWQTLETWHYIAHVCGCIWTCGLWLPFFIGHLVWLQVLAGRAHWVCQGCGRDAG